MAAEVAYPIHRDVRAVYRIPAPRRGAHAVRFGALIGDHTNSRVSKADLVLRPDLCRPMQDVRPVVPSSPRQSNRVSASPCAAETRSFFLSPPGVSLFVSHKPLYVIRLRPNLLDHRATSLSSSGAVRIEWRSGRRLGYQGPYRHPSRVRPQSHRYCPA
jgi:hypothetical protein